MAATLVLLHSLFLSPSFFWFSSFEISCNLLNCAFGSYSSDAAHIFLLFNIVSLYHLYVNESKRIWLHICVFGIFGPVAFALAHFRTKLLLHCCCWVSDFANCFGALVRVCNITRRLCNETQRERDSHRERKRMLTELLRLLCVLQTIMR